MPTLWCVGHCESWHRRWHTHSPAPPHILSAVVGDTVTGLLGAVMEPANRRAPSRAFSEVAVGGAICVRDDLRAAGWAEERAFGAQCWRWARPNMVGVLHRDLLEQTGSPGGLQAALRGNSAAVTSAIATAIAKALLAAADTALSAGPATPEEEKEEEEEENVPVAEDPVNTAVEPETPVAQDKTSVVDSEASTTSEEEMDSCMTSLEEIGSKMTADNSDAVMTSLEVDPCMTSQEDMDSPLTPQMESEAPMTSTVLTDVVMATLGGIPTTEEPLVEEGGKPDGFDMEIPVPLDTAAGDTLLDLPHKEKKQKKGVRRFFARVWKALKRSCCCCCVSTETD
ncbi:uncharacterized protein LOC118210311 isoform X2 [Anguilla anguilla]|nr:uncharacterized protein LOC118210311 isoform X2 [Anguilla anguilla]